MPSKEKTFKDIQSIIAKSPAVSESLTLLNDKNINIKQLSGALKSAYIYSIFAESNCSVCVITQSNRHIDDLEADFVLMGKNNIVKFPQIEASEVKRSLNDNSDEIFLLDSIAKISKSQNNIILAHYDVPSLHLPAKNVVERNKISLKVGESIDYEAFRRELIFNGYEKTDFVSRQGQLSTRGGIIDIFPVGWRNPLRIEFWGDEIESIREFDLLSQRSFNSRDEVEFNSDIVTSTEEEYSTFFEYLPENTIVFIDSPEVIKANSENWESPQYTPTVTINSIDDADITVKSTSQVSVNASIKELVRQIRQLTQQGYSIYIASDGRSNADRLKDLIEDSLSVCDEEDSSLADPIYTFENIIWMIHTPAEGFVLDDMKIALFTEHQVFNRVKSKTLSKSKVKKAGISLKELRVLKYGDYVVHVDRGIGKFIGIEAFNFNGNMQDTVKIEYADGAFLYVNLNYIHKIQRYSSVEGTVPKLSKLGSSDWERKKARTKSRLKDIARDLIKIYAQRKNQIGYSFPADSTWQREFEAAFMYEDTPDQRRASTEVKQDMESESPMDRLVCGDVGFGKTEVAIRAAFKAASAGKQAAVLVPTTILAQQHYESFRDRMKGYPVQVEVISRFRTKKEQTATLERLENGKCDILIGTHRLLSKDVKFKDLGLLIIDEEHRFGVSAKEKLRELRANIDTLTLTATPIPRTLNFSLMGARDLSLIETPPRNRLPIETKVIEWNADRIGAAIHNELKRGGQVYFVNDKVMDIDKLTSRIQAIAPTARIGVAHGQLTGTQLEKEMKRFIERKYDILIATKIVESGLDIPNANTIIINKAQNFGLAELYQLRGRVGRSNKQAYCFLVVPSFSIMSNNILKRLQAIEEFTDLGSGFKLAMRDMEIRGAGNLLGAEQSGFIVDIGYELFHKILDEAVQELRNDEFGDIFDKKFDKKIAGLENNEIAIDINTEALIPATYIESETERFRYYKLFYDLKSADELKTIVDELKDRFGKLPPQLNELLFVVRLRIAALGTGFTKITIRHNSFYAEFPDAENREFYEKAFPEISDVLEDFEDAKVTQDGKRLLLRSSYENRNDIIELFWQIKKALEFAFEG